MGRDTGTNRRRMRSRKGLITNSLIWMLIVLIGFTVLLREVFADFFLPLASAMFESIYYFILVILCNIGIPVPVPVF